MILPDKWKKAIPLFLNGAVFTALGVFALAVEPAWWQPVVAFVASGVNIFFGIKWNPPSTEE